MFEPLKATIALFSETGISAERQAILQPLVDFIRAQKAQGQPIRLNFICTHNSRRSHLSQIWAQTMAHYFGVDNVFSYSGGTEATALFPKVAETLTRQGFAVLPLGTGQNPVYAVKFSATEPPIVAFSKKYDADFNPQSGFAAVMTCNSADEGCPVVFGAVQRIPVKYDDPKAFDGTEFMDAKYAERSLEIGQEMYYVFSACAKMP